jgi:site-specific DNA recombinase
VLAEFERDVVAERTSMAIRHMQSIGKFIGGDLPFGFRVVDGWVSFQEEEQKVVRLARELHGEGLSLRSVAKALTAAGFSTRTGRPFHHNQINRMITGRTRAVTETISS